MNINLLIDIASYTTAISALIGSALAIYRYGIVPIINGCNRIRSSIATLDKIASEMSPNGGRSLRDAITKLTLASEKMNARYTNSIMFSNLAAFESDASGKALWVSRRYSDIFDQTPEYLLGFGWINMVVLEDREAVFQEWNAAVAAKRPCNMKFRINVNNVNIVIDSRALPLINESGELLGFTGVIKIVE